MKKILLVLLLLLSALSSGCSERKDTVASTSDFSLLDEVDLHQTGYKKRVYKKDVYRVKVRTKIPESVGNIYQLKAGEHGIYFNDTESIYRYSDGQIETIFTPDKGQGPEEVASIFRFDIYNDDLIAVSGYPAPRLLLHQLSKDTTWLIRTEFSSNVLFDRRGYVYGEKSNNLSGRMFGKFSSKGDSVGLFGRFFKNQPESLNMFSNYLSYNKKHDMLVIGFMYAGYYINMDTEGNIIRAVESVQYPGRLPLIVKRGGVTYVDEEGKTILRHLASAGDETHVYTAHAMGKDGKLKGALIDVFDALTLTYKFSYLLDEVLHWPILLLDDYSLVAVTEEYDFVIWERNEER